MAAFEGAEDINLRVQIGAYLEPKPGLFDDLQDLGTIDKEYVNRMTKFLVGNFTALPPAEVLRKKAYDRGVYDAFIAVYYKGQRIAILIYPH